MESEGVARRKLVVLGIPWDIDTRGLQQYMSKYGELEDVIVMKDRQTGRSRGFGYVTFATAAQAEEVLQMQHVLGDRRLEVKVATPKEEMKPAGKKSSRIFVARIPLSITEESFRRYFSTFGVITDAYMPKEPGTGTHRGIGFVTFEDAEAVDTVVAQTHELGATQLAVDRALSKDEGGYREREYRPSGGRGYGGGRFRGMNDGYGGSFEPPAEPYDLMPMDGYGGGWGGAGIPPPMGRGGPIMGSGMPRDMPGAYGPGLRSQVGAVGGWGRGRAPGTTKVFVGRLPPFVSLEELRSYFGKYGRVTDVYLPKDAKRSGTRGFGFVTFSDEGAAERVASRPHELNGHPIAVDLATQREEGGGFPMMAASGAGGPPNMGRPISPGPPPLSPSRPLQIPALDAVPYGGIGAPSWASPPPPLAGDAPGYGSIGGVGPYRSTRSERMYRPY